MSDSIIKDLNFWLASVIAGTGMAFAYDIIRLFRSLVHHNSLFINVEDIVYWIICFFTAFTLLYYGNNGVIRFAAVFGASIGMAVYAVSIGQIFVKYMSLCIKKIIFLMLKPILYVSHKIKKSILQILLFSKYQLTKRVNKDKINISYASKKKPVLKCKKGEAEGYEKNKKKKNSSVSPSKE